MKGVIFICLLAAAVCLGKSTNNTGVPDAPPAAASNSSATIPVNPDVKPPVLPQEPATNTNMTIATPPQTVNTTEKTPEQTDATTNKTEPGSNKSDAGADKIDIVPNKTIPDKKGGKDQETSDKVPPKDDKAPTTATPTHATEKATSPKPEVPTKPTAAPHAADDEKPTLQARGFDGASFIGGIILTLGLLAIGFMGFKYYKNTTERNYHTL